MEAGDNCFENLEVREGICLEGLCRPVLIVSSGALCGGEKSSIDTLGTSSGLGAGTLGSCAGLMVGPLGSCVGMSCDGLNMGT